MEAEVIVIVGPTCSGKTSLALHLAKKLNTEIISADSRQVYKYLNIGTAKPSLEQREKILHHFVDYLSPNEIFNASSFSIEAIKIIDKIKESGKVPIIVGGSGLYIRALIDGLLDEVETDEDFRHELYEKRKIHGNDLLFAMLKKIDPESAGKMLPQNWKRVIRALEVYHLTGKPIGYFHSIQKSRNNYSFKQYGMEWDRERLYGNINQRVDNMISDGLVDEVQSILRMGFDKKLNALNTVGYKEIISYLDGDIGFDGAVELIKRNTRRFAKRQITWFKADKRITWLKIDNYDELEQFADKIFKSLI